jgi:hypothetical protein
MASLARGRLMDRNLVLLNRNIAGLRRDVRLQAWEMQQLIDLDIDCTTAARLLMRMQADLVLFIEKRERLKQSELKDGPPKWYDQNAENPPWI